MAELYTMQRYLAPETLTAAGMAQFDAWAANFGEAITSLELAPSGAGYRMHTRFAKFVNLPELLTMFRDFADVQTPEMLNLPRPKLEDGKNKIIIAPATPDLKRFVDSLTERADKIKSGSVDPRDDNMLKITSDGRKAALDMRLVNPLASVHPAAKVNLVINELFAVWKEDAQPRCRGMKAGAMAMAVMGAHNTRTVLSWRKTGQQTPLVTGRLLRHRHPSRIRRRFWRTIHSPSNI